MLVQQQLNTGEPEPGGIRLTQHSHIGADGLHYEGGRFTHNASFQTWTPGPYLLRPRLLTNCYFKWTGEEKKVKSDQSAAVLVKVTTYA